MDYERYNDEIRANFASRVGEITCQYGELIKIEENRKYEATLSIMALQCLLTLCISLYEKGYSKRENKFLSEKISDEPGRLGICKDDIKLNTYADEFDNAYSFIIHIRNALSHSINMHKTSILFPKESGFYSKAKSKKLKSFCFTDHKPFSPPFNATRKRPSGYGTEKEAEKALESIKNSSITFPEDTESIVIKPQKNRLGAADGSFVLKIGEKTIHQTYYVELSLKTVTDLVKNLSHHLAEPHTSDSPSESFDEFLQPALY